MFYFYRKTLIEWWNPVLFYFKTIQIKRIAGNSSKKLEKILLLSDTHSHVDDDFEICSSRLMRFGMQVILAIWPWCDKKKKICVVCMDIDDAGCNGMFRCTIVLCVKESMFGLLILAVIREYNQILGPRWNKSPKLFICGHSHFLKVMFDKSIISCIWIRSCR
jgi:hypothetical protein